MKNQIQNLPENLICFSHLRWDFVFQRPQHLLSRFAKEINVFFLEEPIFDAEDDYLAFSKKKENVTVITPHLNQAKAEPQQMVATMKLMVKNFFKNENLNDWTFWYYTPMALQFSEVFTPKLTVYDCMDELSAFKFAPKELPFLEKKLFQKADVIFTGGHCLYQAKKNLHKNIFPFPSSIEKEHFAVAREKQEEPQDQAGIQGKKIGFYGVIDERFDIELIRSIADQRPEWQLMLIGPTAKIDEQQLPKNANIHYLGQKTYQELPAYLSGWDVALIPFLLNESTRFISPTKTPEYLAAGVPVVSSGITDVVHPYGKEKIVSIASGADEFIEAIEMELHRNDNGAWLAKIDELLADFSWDDTYLKMRKKMCDAITANSMNLISIAS